ncbi:MAG: hypothetical protein AAF458_12415 [Pseudomonadota bacterium]
MNWLISLYDAASETLILSGRARVLSQLRQMDDAFLRAYGFSPEKVNKGVAAWPWRAEDPEAITEPNVVVAAIASNDHNADLPRAA